MTEYWRRREDLDAEVQSLMGSSEFIVYDDVPHSCIHICRGDQEFTSAMFPLNDEIRNDLRQQVYLLHNGLDADERKRIAEANEKRDAYSENLIEEAKADVREEQVWTYNHDFLGRGPISFVVPGVQK